MEAEKKRSKGGFLNLFDWNVKSRKKLFVNTSEELSGPHGSKEEKEDVDNLAKPSNCTVDLDENEASSSNKGSGDWNSASCVTSEEDGGGASRAPSVVARLMGLDSMPSSSSGQLSDSSPVRSSHHDRTNLRSEVYAADYANMSSRFETFSRTRVDLRYQRHHHNMPIERFQTEVLPPRSAKSISITHHKLLSPIKNPGFVPTKNASYIMEAGAKIIEASPRSSAKSKATLNVGVGTSSVPLRIRDLKEKIEAANKASSRTERPKEIGGGSSKYGNRFRNGSEYVLVTRESVESESRNLHNARANGRSVSPSGQAKTSLSQRNGNKSVGNRRELKSNPVSKCQPNAQRSEQKRNSPESSTNILRQNNQKQNCVSSKEKLAGKNSVSRNLPRRTRSANGSVELTKTPVNKVSTIPKTGPKKVGSASTVSQRKKFVSSSGESASSGSRLTGEAERAGVKCNVSMESCSSMSPESRKPGMDVISFTFNSPLKKSPRESSRSSLEAKRFRTDSSIVGGDKDQSHHYSSGFTISSPGMNVIGADSLSALLEQKLLELTSKVQLYESNRAREESSGSCESKGKQVQICVLRDQPDGKNNGYVSPHVDSPSPSVNHHWQGREDREECSGSSNNTGKELEYSDLSPESSFEISFESGTFTDNRSYTTTGSKGCSYTEAQSRIALSHDTDSLSESESALSSSAHDTKTKQGPRPSDVDGDWELEYVRDVLDNSELAAAEFATGGADGDIIAGDLFERLESRWERVGEECSKKLGRKVVFDCVGECLESRRSEGTWARGWTRLPPRKDWLAEELHGEMSGWKGMCDWMLDELVENEMSTRLGRWLDFDCEAFEEGVDVGEAVLDSLVDELVLDLMVVF